MRVTRVLLLLFVLRVLAGITYEYHGYFPPNFQVSEFLRGREAFFTGVYRFAFYSHIICGPCAILVGLFLYWSGKRQSPVRLHRVLGKVQFLLIVIVLVPSGSVMATRAYTGAIAGAGFVLLASTTLAATILTVVHVKRGDLVQHRRWASRLSILLLSPIVLRVSSVLFAEIGIESRVSYPFSAWASWLIPLAVFELSHFIRYRGSNEQLHLPSDLDPIHATTWRT